MKNNRFIQMALALGFILCSVTTPSIAGTISLDVLIGPVFVQPFAGLAVVSESGGIGRTEPFFSDLPDGSLPGNRVVEIAGNFQAFDPFGIPTTFDIVGVEVDDMGSTFSPELTDFDFAGEPSVTFTDSIDFDQVTFFAGDLTVALHFVSDEFLDYSKTFLTTGLPVGSFILFDDVETGKIPEPATALLLVAGLTGLAGLGRRRVLNAPYRNSRSSDSQPAF